MSLRQWLQLEYQAQRVAINLRVESILARGEYLHGREVVQLEEQLADYCGVSHAVCCASGSDALVLGLQALGIGPGSAVYTPAFGFVAGAEAIVRVGAMPVFVDVEARSGNLDAAALLRSHHTLAEILPNRPQAVLAIDLFGVPANYERLEPVCDELGLPLIEDAAQAFGASLGAQPAGSFGQLATLSFFPTKPLGGAGDGGAVLTNNASLAAAVRSLCAHGWEGERHNSQRVGMNSRIDTLQAGILLEKLDVVEQARQVRENIASRFTRALPKEFIAPFAINNGRSAWAQYCVVAPSGDAREKLLESLRDNDVAATVYYPRPIPEQPAFRRYRHHMLPCPISEQLCRRILAIPLHAHMPEEAIERTLRCLNGKELDSR